MTIRCGPVKLHVLGTVKTFLLALCPQKPMRFGERHKPKLAAMLSPTLRSPGRWAICSTPGSWLLRTTVFSDAATGPSQKVARRTNLQPPLLETWFGSQPIFSRQRPPRPPRQLGIPSGTWQIPPMRNQVRFNHKHGVPLLPSRHSTPLSLVVPQIKFLPP